MDKQEKIVKGIFGLGILLVMLLIATGSVSAADCGGGNACNCGDTVTSSYTFSADLDCSGTTGHGLIVGASNIVIDGAGYKITGNESSTACQWCDEDDPQYHCGIYNYQHDNVIIKNLEVENFCNGIVLKGTLGNKIENNTIENCTVHDNGNATSGKTYGIYLAAYVRNSTVNNNTICNNTGEVTTGCGTGGHGIKLYGRSNYNNITDNTIYNNTLAGIYSKMRCEYNNVTYNKVYENGKVVGGATAYFGGGIRLECYNTKYWNVSYNTVTDNIGPGIHVRGDHNNITHNDVTNNKNASTNTECAYRGLGDGIYLCGDYNNVTYNRVCNNNGTDIYNMSGTSGNTFDENICYNSHPSGLCEYPCVYPYGDYNNSRPPATCDVPSATTLSKSNIRVKDGVSVQSNTGAHTGNYATQRFNFTVTEDSTKIEKIKVIWYGRGRHDNGSDYHGAYLYIWNKTGGTGYDSDLNNTSSGDWRYLTGEVNTTDGISNYISANNNVTILVEQKCKDATGWNHDSHIWTDLAKIVIYFKDP